MGFFVDLYGLLIVSSYFPITLKMVFINIECIHLCTIEVYYTIRNWMISKFYASFEENLRSFWDWDGWDRWWRESTIFRITTSGSSSISFFTETTLLETTLLGEIVVAVVMVALVVVLTSLTPTASLTPQTGSPLIHIFEGSTEHTFQSVRSKDKFEESF